MASGGEVLRNEPMHNIGHDQLLVSRYGTLVLSVRARDYRRALSYSSASRNLSGAAEDGPHFDGSAFIEDRATPRDFDGLGEIVGRQDKEAADPVLQLREDVLRRFRP